MVLSMYLLKVGKNTSTIVLGGTMTFQHNLSLYARPPRPPHAPTPRARAEDCIDSMLRSWQTWVPGTNTSTQ